MEFSSEDGTIECIQIEKEQVNVFFRTWDGRLWNLRFVEMDTVQASDAVGSEIGEYYETETPNGSLFCRFHEAWNGQAVLTITAKSVQKELLEENGKQ